ncbi:hypothetical protein Gotur_016164 [Gossypium turneri]
MIHFSTMHHTLTNLRHPLGGIQITNLKEKWFLLWYFNRVDFDRVVKDAPWTFNNHLLVFHCLGPSEDPLSVPLVYSYFWVQVYFATKTKLPLFCFLCGRLGHGNSFCPIQLTRDVTTDDMGWNISLRAVGHRVVVVDNIWLQKGTIDGSPKAVLLRAILRATEHIAGLHSTMPKVHYSEDASLAGIDGKKRQRIVCSSGFVSEGSDSPGVGDK